MAKTSKKILSEQERKDWDDLYTYVKKNVMGYDENQALSKTMVLRLKGLLTNKFIANNNIKDTANYSYNVVLNTFKFCMPDIQRGLNKNSFKDEMHKFLYVTKIVENNLNNVYMRMKNAKKAKQELNIIDKSNIDYKGAEYKPKAKMDDKFSDLW